MGREILTFVRRFMPYFRDYLGRFSLASVGGVISACAYAGAYLLIKPVLDGVFIQGDRQLHLLIPPAIIVLYLILAASRYLQTYELCWIGEDITRRLRDQLLTHVLELDLAFFTGHRGGELISRITNDISRVRLAVSQHLAVIARESLSAIGLLGVAFYWSPLLALCGLVGLPAVAWPLSKLASRFKGLSHRSQEKESDITARLNENFNNMEIIKAYATEQFEAQRFRQDNLEFRRINMKGTRVREITNPLMHFLGSFASATVVFFGGMQIIQGRMTPGEFSSFAAALFGLYTPIKRIATVFSQMIEAVAAQERIFTLLSRQPTIRSGTTRLNRPITSIELEDVSLSFGESAVVNGISLAAYQGQTIALIGDSGGGKSSLMRLILRLFDPSSGVVRINGVDARQLDVDDLRRRISVVTQRTYLFNDTVAANIAYGQAVDRDRVVAALKKAQAWEFVSCLPKGIDTIVEEFGANLSGGQQQRLSIARALYREPEVLILDEATSALDYPSEAAVQRAVAAQTQGRITFIVAHRLRTTDLAQRIFVIRDGQVVGAGSKDELMVSCEEYRRLALLNEPQAAEQLS